MKVTSMHKHWHLHTNECMKNALKAVAVAITIIFVTKVEVTGNICPCNTKLLLFALVIFLLAIDLLFVVSELMIVV